GGRDARARGHRPRPAAHRPACGAPRPRRPPRRARAGPTRVPPPRPPPRRPARPPCRRTSRRVGQQAAHVALLPPPHRGARASRPIVVVVPQHVQRAVHGEPDELFVHSPPVPRPSSPVVPPALGRVGA